MFLEDTDCLFLFMSRQCYLPVREVRTLQKSFAMRVLVITDSKHDAVEISIYSTCKRISQKILRNVAKFAMMVADGDYKNLNFTVKRENMEVSALLVCLLALILSPWSCSDFLCAGNQFTRASRAHRRAHHQQLSEQGKTCLFAR